ncbi:methylmalonyl-CoA mutase family protein [Capnocytophaga cynodegmi]|uniref:methylmalonyl-CoA mutase family protein n=1 Tax=Capnocytophaga cynodegmi TaxID=28189 RepID=UPI00385A9C7A
MMEMYSEETPKTTIKQWKQQIQFELQGTDYNDLLYKSHEGISLLPFYSSENRQFTYEVNTEAKGMISLYCSNVQHTLQRIDFWLSQNIQHFFITLHYSEINWEEFLSQLPEKGVYFIDIHYLNPSLVQKLSSLIKNVSQRIFICNDCINEFLKKGKWGNNQISDLEIVKNSISSQNPVIFVDTTLYQNAGAGIIQQIAYGISQAMEYFKLIDKYNIINELNLCFKVAVGNNFMLETSKTRAFRQVAESVFETFGYNIKIFFIAEPSNRGLSISKSKYNENCISLAYESAILSGADFVIPKNPIIYKKNTIESDLSNAEQIQKIIQNRKAYFLNGICSFETISYEIAKKSLVLFQNTEKSGGLLEQVKNHTLQRKIKEKAQEEQILFEEKVKNINFKNQFFTSKEEWELYPFVRQKTEKTLVEPLIAKRLWENIEKRQLKK